MAVKSTSTVPVRKVTAGGAAGAVTVILVFVINTYVSPAKPLSPEIASAITTVLSFVAAYLVPSSAGGAAGAVTVILVFVINTYVSPAKPLSPEIASAITTVLSFVAAYLVP